MTEAKPLSAEEIAAIKCWAEAMLASTYKTRETIERLIATIEQRDEQIEKLRTLSAAIAEDVRHLADMIDEALANTEPVND